MQRQGAGGDSDSLGYARPGHVLCLSLLGSAFWVVPQLPGVLLGVTPHRTPKQYIKATGIKIQKRGQAATHCPTQICFSPGLVCLE
eukprot:1161508-Pelagomonas_calceolata.AAC.9